VPDALAAYNIGDYTLRRYKRGLTSIGGSSYKMKFENIRSKMG
jgi:hypothetical protein